MDCPYCTNETTKVTDKRNSPEGIRRRRECLKCGKRFTTYEKIDRGELWVMKKGGNRERFSLDKIKIGVNRAFEKRPVSQDKIDKMIREIEDQLRKKGKKEVNSSVIGELIIKRLDNVAYIRFASVYKDFQDVKDFKQEIKKL